MKIRYARAQPRTAAGHGEHRFLGELQGEIMELAWARGEVTVREALIHLQARRQITYNTVMTVMSRLAEQGVLMRERLGKTDVYRPARTREQFRADISEEMVTGLVADFGEVALAQFVDALERSDPARLARVRALLEEGHAHDAGT